jgi:hypothetical protein
MKSDDIDFEEDAQSKSALREFRDAAHRMTERSEGFWADQRFAVMEKISQRRKGLSFRPILVWGGAVVLVLMVIGIWIEVPRALPAPDFAAGYDQDLLSDVERLTVAQAPIALEPAFLLAAEIRAGIGAPKEPQVDLPRRR